MNPELTEFFKNPTDSSAIVAAIVVISQIVMYLLQNKKAKKDNIRADNTQQKNTEAFDGLTNKVQLLIDKEINHVNLSAAEIVIKGVLYNSKHAILQEIKRIFTQNHRDRDDRRTLIKRAYGSLTEALYKKSVQELSQFYYKEIKLSEFLCSIDKDDFFTKTMEQIFTISNPNTDYSDTVLIVDNYFDSYLIHAREYLQNL